MKTFLRLNFALICAYLFCANCVTIALNVSNKAQTNPEECTKSLSVSIEDTYSETELINRLKKTVECLKILSGNKGRQDDDDDDDFQLPSYVPEIIKVVGSVLTGNASSLVSNSLTLIDSIPGAGGAGGGIGNTIQGLIETLTTSLSQSRPIIPTKPPRRRTTRGPTRKPPMRNRTRRTTTGNPLLNQITNLNSTINNQNSGVPAPTLPTTITNTRAPGGSPIIFVLPNIPNGISGPDLAKNPELLHQVVNQSINALQQPINNQPVNKYPNANTQQQTNSNVIQQEQSVPVQQETNVSKPVNPIPPQQATNTDQMPNPPSSNNVFSNGNLTFVTSEQPTLTQEQLLTNLLTILTKLSQQPTNSQSLPVAQSPGPVPVTPSVTNITIPSTTESEYYYYEDDETTPAAVNSTENAIKATTVDEDDDDDGAAAAAAAAIVIKAGEANANKTKVTAEVSPTVDPVQSLAAPITGKTKITKETTVKSINKDKEIDYYDEDYDSATTPKTVALPPVIKVIQKATTKLPPAIENDEEEAEAQPYSTVRSKNKEKVPEFSAPQVTQPNAPPPEPVPTPEEIDEYYDENEKITTRRKVIYSKTTAKITAEETDEDDTENLFKVKARFK